MLVFNQVESQLSQKQYERAMDHLIGTLPIITKEARPEAVDNLTKLLFNQYFKLLMPWHEYNSDKIEVSEFTSLENRYFEIFGKKSDKDEA